MKREIGWPRTVLVAYGILNIVMGVQAYFFPFHVSDPEKGPSIISLVAGGGAGMLILMAAWLSRVNRAAGYGMGFAASLLLAFTFLRGVINLERFSWYPNVFGLVLALAVAGLLGLGHLQQMKADRTPAEG
ncbi:MAG: hypothetical protein MH204_12555 [Fimbriimonadaceae bacterium]|nr:hypothetical protein [Fimbriimonadaceae bacterium]